MNITEEIHKLTVDKLVLRFIDRALDGGVPMNEEEEVAYGYFQARATDDYHLNISIMKELA